METTVNTDACLGPTPTTPLYGCALSGERLGLYLNTSLQDRV